MEQCRISNDFAGEVESLIARGAREMLRHVQERLEFKYAFYMLVCEFEHLVVDYHPSQEEVKKARDRLREKVEYVGDVLRLNDIDARVLWNIDEIRASLLLLKAVDPKEKHASNVIDVKNDALDLLSEKGNFTREGAQRLVTELAVLGCNSISEALVCMDESPNHTELLRFLEKNGTPNVKNYVNSLQNCMRPEEKKMAKVVEFIKPAPKPLQRMVRQL